MDLISWSTKDCIIIWIVFSGFFKNISGINCTTDAMELSTNISMEITNVTKTQAVLRWSIRPFTNVTGIDLSVKQFHEIGIHYRTVTELDLNNRSWTLSDLSILTTYEVYLDVFFRDETSCRSNKHNFTTLEADVVTKAVLTYIAETTIVIAILSAWGLAVYLFINQWGRLRVTPERHPRYKHAPKNIENVKVVKRANDSVIYKNYGRQMSFTMEKREKRIERINTLRQLGIDPQQIDRINISLVKDNPLVGTSDCQPSISTVTDYTNGTQAT